MAHFRVEFVLDQSSGKYLAEMYHPENEGELLVRTEALYPTQAAAVLGVVQLFKNAILKFPEPAKPPRVKKAKKKSKKPKKAKKKARKAPRRRRR
ncbi:MAG TPA: hypothetical protein VMN03_14565 [Burkholderiales bacterium]|nr:hypothetical protein [Burkholderiales bacterium]